MPKDAAKKEQSDSERSKTNAEEIGCHVFDGEADFDGQKSGEREKSGKNISMS